MGEAGATSSQRSAAPQVCCAVPVYNNAATIRDVARRCREQLGHVVVIDDGSTDADVSALLAGLDVTVLRHPVNRGKGAAILTALHHAAAHGAKYLLTIDGDSQHFPEDIPLFLKRLDPDTLLIGHRDEVVGVMPRASSFGREFSDFWIFVETGQVASDTQSGLRVYPVEAMRRMRLVGRRYNFEVEVVTRALWAGLKVAKVPIRVWYPQRDRRVSSFRPLLDNLRISLTHARLSLRCLVPWPHRRLVLQEGASLSRRMNALLFENATPLGLAASAALAACMIPFPLPWLRVAIVVYLGARLHLNLLMAVVITMLGICTDPLASAWCVRIGHWLCHGKSIDPREAALLLHRPWPVTWEWFLGSFMVAPPLFVAMALAVYATARGALAPRVERP